MLASMRGAAGEWDSAERRETHASALEGHASKESIDAWKQADVDNAKHPREAVRRTGDRMLAVRRTRGADDRAIRRGRDR